MQKIFVTALVAGIISGIFSFGVQTVKLTPLILQAETYEVVSEEDAHSDHSHAHEHSADAWQPADGFERAAYTLLADIGVGVGFALILVGAFVLRGEEMDMKRGILWGIAGFTVFSLAPSFGLPPELPTTLAADLQERQIWWVGTALATAIGLYSVTFINSNALKILGLSILVLPHVIGAPNPPLGGAVPTELNAEFAAASLGTMAMFWVVLGATAGWFYSRKQAKQAVQ